MSKLGEAIEKFFPCSSCGCCCSRVNIAVSNIDDLAREYKIDKEQLSFPYNWDESGKCKMLTLDNRCSVYNDRPLICSIDRFIEKANLDKEEFYKLNILTCNKLMDDDGIDKNFRITPMA